VEAIIILLEYIEQDNVKEKEWKKSGSRAILFVEISE